MKAIASVTLFSLTVLLSVCNIGNAQPEQIPILVIVETPTDLGVDYRTGAKLARNLILLGSLLDVALDASTASRHSKKLRKIIGVHDRTPIVEQGFVGGFSVQPYFKVTIAHSTDAYGTVKKPYFDIIRSAGFSHVLVVEEEFAGLITAWEMSTLSATTRLSYRLIDSSSGKTLTKEKINGFAGPKYTYEDATTNPDLFLQDYPQAVGAAIGRIVGDLRKNGYLSQIARQHGLGDKVPDTASILRQYERRFSYKYKRPKGWKTVNMNTKYVTVLAPKEDDAYYGLNVTFDLLLEEFGQKVSSVEDYARILLKRTKAHGFQVVPDKFPGLELNDDFVMYTVEQKTSGTINVLLFKKLDENFIVIYSIVITENFNELYAKYKARIETIINTARIKTK